MLAIILKNLNIIIARGSVAQLALMVLFAVEPFALTSVFVADALALAPVNGVVVLAGPAVAAHRNESQLTFDSS